MNYLILSDGEYSDYSATWYGGVKEISNYEFQAKGKAIGDELNAWFFNLPENKYGNRTKEDGVEVDQYDLSDLWKLKMVEWLSSEGYSRIEAKGEINVCYSEYPHS